MRKGWLVTPPPPPLSFMGMGLPWRNTQRQVAWPRKSPLKGQKRLMDMGLFDIQDRNFDKFVPYFRK